MKNKVHIINKKAKFEYNLNESFISGIVLTGSEIKSIRNNKVSIRDGFCKFLEDELFIINMNIEKYEFSNDEVYNPKRQRKLLLNSKTSSGGKGKNPPLRSLLSFLLKTLLSPENSR